MTDEEYKKQTIEMLMGKSFYTPLEVRERVEQLLKIESRAKEIYKTERPFIKCPYCGRKHK
jgi:hypothetical protein